MFKMPYISKDENYTLIKIRFKFQNPKFNISCKITFYMFLL